MSHIVFTTIGSLGDLHPMIAIALELKKRHHHVVFATHQRYQEKLEALGFDFYPIPPDLNPNDDPEVAAEMMDIKTGTQVVSELIFGHLRETYAALSDCAKNADIIIAGEGAYTARLISEKTGIPWVSVVLQPAAFLSPYDMPVLPMMPWLAKLQRFGLLANKGVVQLVRVMTKSWAKPLHSLRSELKLPPLKGHPLVDDKYSPYLVLAMFSSAYAQPQSDWPNNTVLAGFPFYDGSYQANNQSAHLPDTPALSADIEQFLQNGTPPIVFTLGSAAVATPGHFYLDSIQSAKQLNRRAILLMGDNDPPTDLPSNILAVGYVPHSQIFPRACAIVHQGGIGTTAQALRAGKPTLIVPYSHDQPDNAARAKRLGPSLTVNRGRYSASTATQYLNQLLSKPSYQKDAREIATKIKTENGVQTACNAIEKQLIENNSSGRITKKR